ncbi:Uu.00g040190.m01.CDS01 [Anthostomella pinea]|uniref:Uu.00g040190.m01.CDS01 n=1 Tax=Anthostomella pinea TaxID=933095 RepID=A0AAI8YDT7_9PEZI|nr:Uu.00g040190.m01.CDS01 [Anthostomella pinea]
MSAANTLLRSAVRASTTARAATRNGLVRRPLTRTYADSKPPLAHGGHNRGLIIALVGITVPALGYFTMMREVKTDPTKISAPALDPAARKRERDAAEPDRPKYIHPEHEDPELQAPFGRVHKRKRVDGPLDDRNHQSLQDRQRQI